MDELDDAMREALGARYLISRDALVCKCGHTGYLVETDRCAPYSCLLIYSWEGFTGSEVHVTDYDYVPERLLATLNPVCPKCGRSGTVGYPKPTPAERRKAIAEFRRRERYARLKAAKVKRPAKKSKAKAAVKTVRIKARRPA